MMSELVVGNSYFGVSRNVFRSGSDVSAMDSSALIATHAFARDEIFTRS